MQMARLASYQKHQKIVKMLMKEYRRVQPENFHPVSIDQIHTADKEIFLLMSELTESGLDTAEPGSYPLDAVIEKVVEDPRIKALLNPFPMARGGGGSGSGGTKRESESQALMDLKAENKRLRMGQQAVGKNSGAKGKGKGEKKGKGKIISTQAVEQGCRRSSLA